MFFDFPFLKKSFQIFKRFLVLGDQQKSRGFFIQAVNNSGANFVLADVFNRRPVFQEPADDTFALVVFIFRMR